jgi:hypothetical protein
MFNIKRTEPIIPGYTGFLPKTFGEEDGSQRPKPHGEIPGYAGFIPAVKAENLFAKTYGKLTYISSAGEHEKGSEIPDELRYTSVLQNTFVNQRQVSARTVADVVGVVPKKTIYTESGPFKVDAQVYNSTIGFGKKASDDNKQEQTMGDSSKLFYGENLTEKGAIPIGNPIPGYTGVSKRVVADNIFGCTYAEARRRGDESHSNVSKDKLNNFTTQSKMVPPVKK